MEIAKAQNKFIYIEKLRVAATLAVIFLHCYTPYFTDSSLFGTKTWWGVNILNAFTRWGVPVFLMISGMLLLDAKKQESLKEFITKRSSRVLIPFALWSVIYYFAVSCFTKSKISVLGFVLKFIDGDIAYHLWFVYTLFGLYLLVPLLRKLISAVSQRELWYLFTLVFLVTTVRPVFNRLLNVSIPPMVPLYEGYLAWFLYGYLLNKIDFTAKWRLLTYLGGVAAGLFSIFGTYALSSIHKIDDFFNGGYQFNSYMMATAVFVLFKYELGALLKRLDPMMDAMGRLSYGVYLVHILVLSVLQRVMKLQPPSLQIVVYALLTFVISYGIMYLLSKIPKLGFVLTGTK